MGKLCITHDDITSSLRDADQLAIFAALPSATEPTKEGPAGAWSLETLFNLVKIGARVDCPNCGHRIDSEMPTPESLSKLTRALVDSWIGRGMVNVSLRDGMYRKQLS